jgi:hypothetical protein
VKFSLLIVSAPTEDIVQLIRFSHGIMSHKIAAKETRVAPRAAPAVEVVQEHVSVLSPVKPLSYAEADAKTRKGADSLSFNTTNGCLGHVDVVSIRTKVLCKDHQDIGIVRGVDERNILYTRVYNGYK